MGFLGNLLSGGQGLAGAHNAHLAELEIKRLTAATKKRVADKVLEMGMSAYRGRQTVAEFMEFFNDHERLYQLNCIALALHSLHIDSALPGEAWMEVRNPFAVPTDRHDLEVNAYHFSKTHGVTVCIGSERINLKEWEAASFNLDSAFNNITAGNGSFLQPENSEGGKIIVSCPSCQQRLRIPSGRCLEVKCAKCGNSFESRASDDTGKGAEEQYRVGITYYHGDGVPTDYKAAENWFEKSARQGHAKAQYNLGVMFSKGQGVAQDYAKAIHFFQKAAAQGVAESQCELGKMYGKGEGVPQDDVEALKWFVLAASKGDAEAKICLHIAEEVMSVDQVENAKRRAECVKAQTK